MFSEQASPARYFSTSFLSQEQHHECRPQSQILKDDRTSQVRILLNLCIKLDYFIVHRTTLPFWGFLSNMKFFLVHWLLFVNGCMEF